MITTTAINAGKRRDVSKAPLSTAEEARCSNKGVHGCRQHKLWRAGPFGQPIFVKETLNDDAGVIQDEQRLGAAEAGQR